MVSSAKRRTRAILTGIILFISLLAIVITGFGTGGFGSIDSLISGGGQATGTTIATVATTDGNATVVYPKQGKRGTTSYRLAAGTWTSDVLTVTVR